MHYRHLGIYSDLVQEAIRQQPLYPIASPGIETRQKVCQVLGWCDLPETPQDVRIERQWEQDGLYGEEITWSVGYGPRTSAWLFKPVNATQPLPAVLALHDHGGFKFYGKEKISEGPEPAEDMLLKYRQNSYGGQAWVNALARQGLVVLVHDTFLWGSRRFPLPEMKEGLFNPSVPANELMWASSDGLIPHEIAEYNYLAALHEHVISKYLNVLGGSMPGVVSHEDRIALNYLCSRPEVLPERVGCMGLSGGGNRAGLLMATADNLKAAVIVGLMSTYAGLLDHNISIHTWMLFPFAWARFGDWPDLVACRAPAPLLVQYDVDDALFTVKGMQDAHERLALHYQASGYPQAYTGQFYPGPHKFDLEMQAAAFSWLKTQLGGDQGANHA